MKKLMFALVAAMAMGVANAATASWGASNILKPGTKTSEKVDSVAAYVFATAWGGNASNLGADGAALVTLAAVTEAIESGDFMKNYASKAYYSGSTSSTGTLSGQFATGFAQGDSLTAFVIIFDNANAANAENYMIATSSSTQTLGQQELSKSWTSGTGGQTFTWASQASTAWNAVPEPTSGILLLLGVASLALRRRRA